MFVILLIVGCSGTHIIKKNDYAKRNIPLEISSVYLYVPEEKIFKVSMGDIGEPSETYDSIVVISQPIRMQEREFLKSLYGSFEKELIKKFKVLIVPPDSKADLTGIVIELKPTRLHKHVNGGKRIEIKSTVTLNGEVIWSSRIASFGAESISNKDLVDGFILKLQDELRVSNISFTNRLGK